MYDYRGRRAWSEHEDQLLKEAVEREEPGTTNPSKWHAIAKHVPNRSNKDCRKRWCSKLAISDLVKGNWASDEDERLRKAIEKYGTKWTLVAPLVRTRNSDQCAKRWKDTLDPSIDHTTWSLEEDALLRQAVAKHGRVWSMISKTYFPGRTGLAAKNRYNSITRANSCKGGFQPSHKHCLCGSEDSTPSSGSMSPATSASLLTDFSDSPAQACLNLEGFPWTDVRFPLPDIDDTAVGTFMLDELLALPISQRASGLEHSDATILSTSMHSDSSLSSVFGPPSSDPLIPMLSPGVHPQPSFFSPKPSELKLFGSAFCPSTARVQIVLNEKHIPYKFINLDTSIPLTDDHQLGRQPYINDNGFILSESRAICRYLATKYSGQGTKLVPDAFDIQAVALLEQAIFVELSHFDKFAYHAGYEKIMERTTTGGISDESCFEMSLSKISSTLDGYESILSRRRYLAGDEPTLADLYHIPCGWMLSEAGSNIMTSKGPNVTRWWNDITSRDSWKSVHSQVHTRNDQNIQIIIDE